MQYDVKAEHAEASGTLVSGRNRLKGYQLLSGGTAGDIVFTDGGSGGIERLRLNISNNLAPISTLIPGEGILFTTDIYVTLPTSAKITVFYG
jgi:hypothetical protein